MPERELTSELRHRQQQRRTVTTILVMLLVLFFAFWYAYSYYRNSTQAASPASSESSCRPFDPKVVTPANTTVNVYNATQKDGLAGRTAAALRSRGYAIGKVSNDPLKRTIKGPAEIRFGPAGKSRAALILPLSGKGATQLGDKRKDATVDLVLGGTFTSLAPAPKATGKPMCPSPTARPSATMSATTSAS